MGFWGTALYDNDCTCDVRDTYLAYIRQNRRKITFRDICRIFKDYLDTDEEALLWYAIADTQWHLGDLFPEVRDRAVYWLQNSGGMEQWKEAPDLAKEWRKTIEHLSNELKMTLQTQEAEDCVDFQYNPGVTGDVYAYQFHTATARKMGYYGKYILMQKVGVIENGRGFVCPHFLCMDKLFDDIPTAFCLSEMRVLPFDVPDRFMPNGKNVEFPHLNISAVLDLSKKKNNPAKYMNYIGNFSIHSTMKLISSGAEFGWDCIEDTLIYYHSEWMNYAYTLLPDESVVSRINISK